MLLFGFVTQTQTHTLSESLRNLVFDSSTMASALQKLLRKPPLPPPSRFITAFHPSQSPNPITSPPNTEPSTTIFPPVLTHRFVGSSCSTPIFPSFPFGFASKPVFDSGFRFLPPDAEEDAVGSEDSGTTLWADSVKKKRKRKMNKHKYQKLRKRMRRQT